MEDERIEAIVEKSFDFIGEKLRKSAWMKRLLRESFAWQKSMTRLEKKKNRSKEEDEVYDSLGIDIDSTTDKKLEAEMDEILATIQGQF